MSEPTSRDPRKVPTPPRVSLPGLPATPATGETADPRRGVEGARIDAAPLPPPPTVRRPLALNLPSRARRTDPPPAQRHPKARPVERQAPIIPIKRRSEGVRPLPGRPIASGRNDDTIVSSPSELFRIAGETTATGAAPTVPEVRVHGSSAPLPTAEAWTSPTGVAAAIALVPEPVIAEPPRLPEPPPPPATQRATPPAIPTVAPWFGPQPGTGEEPALPPLTAPPPASPPVSSPYSIFEKLGLGPNKDVQQRAAKAMVTTYRLMGFAILSIIVLVLAGYIATSAFYFVSDSWIQPMVVSPSDEKVLSLNSQIADQANVRDKIAVDLAHTERYIAVQQEFQAEFAKAIRSDLGDRKAALGRLRALADDYRGARTKIEKSNRAYAQASSKQMANEYKAGLIDRGGMLNGRYQLAQITSSNLSLAEREADYETRAAALATEARALDAILHKKGGDQALSYDVLRIKQEYELSQLETTKAVASRDALKDSLARQDAILSSLRQSPYLLAASGQAHVAFVPYDNLDNVEVGAPVYRCALGMIFCRNVGKAIELMSGEVTFKHPQRDQSLRGQMLILELEDGAAAHEDVLFIGGRPLFI